ncbi:hypothetical protein FZEAL_1161 [Fusarium zealandicum]|uniref:Uncharacterized protein n=1 Tax=Fusarium zealandicum TaxID=1053134 RepID=A0A8H4UU50_9HYPO|nr:hypothetical protein FZEAL_1161 [Fusarium zealandicum]
MFCLPWSGFSIPTCSFPKAVIAMCMMCTCQRIEDDAPESYYSYSDQTSFTSSSSITELSGSESAPSEENPTNAVRTWVEGTASATSEPENIRC